MIRITVKCVALCKNMQSCSTLTPSIGYVRPAQAYFLSDPMTLSGAYRGMTFGSCSMLNSSVASRPA